MKFKARTLKENIFIFGFGGVAQVGKVSFLEVNLRCKRRRWPWDLINPRFWKKTEHFFNNAKQDSETTTLLAAVRCCVTATLAAL